MRNEYRIVGKYGQWGEVEDTLEHAMDEKKYADEHHDEVFRIEVREVSEWQPLGA
jgi:hypothetical protein